MFDSGIIDAAIGLVFVFVFVSLVASSVAEGIEGILKTRAMDLEKGIREILSDPDGKGTTKDLFDHPLIHSLFVGDYDPEKIKQDIRWPWQAPQSHMRWFSRRSLPSYIPGSNFATALLDLVARGAVKASGDASEVKAPDPAAKEFDLEAWRTAAAKIENEPLRRAFLTALDYGDNKLETVKSNLAAWFDSSMDRVSGWYKRRVQLILFCIGILAAVVLNIDAITTATRLMNDDALRDSVVALAKKSLDAGKLEPQPAPEATTNDDTAAGDKPTSLSLNELKVELGALGFPMGWENWRPGPQFAVCYEEKGKKKKDPRIERSCSPEEAAFIWVRIVFGWLITAFAVMFGAPFWFDLLGKLVTLRASGNPPGKEGAKT